MFRVVTSVKESNPYTLFEKSITFLQYTYKFLTNNICKLNKKTI